MALQAVTMASDCECVGSSAGLFRCWSSPERQPFSGLAMLAHSEQQPVCGILQGAA